VYEVGKEIGLLRFFSIIALLYLYTFWKVTQLWEASPVVSSLVTLGTFIFMLAPQFLYRSKSIIHEALFFRVWTWLGAIVMGIWATFFILSVLFDIALVFVGFFGTFDSHRQHLWILEISILTSAVGLLQVLRGPRIKRVFVPIANLADDLIGFTIAQVSDLHVGPTIRRGYVEKVTRRINAHQPDIVVLTGDIGDAAPTYLETHFAPLSGLRGKYGVFYVTGNHEYYWGIEKVLEQVKAVGCRILLNEHEVLRVKGSKLMVAGVTDSSGGHFDPAHEPNLIDAISTHESVQCKVLLSHRPELYDQAERLGVQVQISGHTHAGQFFPFSLFIGFAHKYYRGLHAYKNLWLYVNPGTGYWGPANRFASASEITLLTLQKAR